VVHLQFALACRRDRERSVGCQSPSPRTFDPHSPRGGRDQSIPGQRGAVRLRWAAGQKSAAGRPVEDLLSTLVRAEEAAPSSPWRAVASVFMLRTAGRTTADLIGPVWPCPATSRPANASSRPEPDLIELALTRCCATSLHCLSPAVPPRSRVRVAGSSRGREGPFFGHAQQTATPGSTSGRRVRHPRGPTAPGLSAAGPHFCLGNRTGVFRGEIFFASCSNFSGSSRSRAGRATHRRFFQHGYAKPAVIRSASPSLPHTASNFHTRGLRPLTFTTKPNTASA